MLCSKMLISALLNTPHTHTHTEFYFVAHLFLPLLLPSGDYHLTSQNELKDFILIILDFIPSQILNPGVEITSGCDVTHTRNLPFIQSENKILFFFFKEPFGVTSTCPVEAICPPSLHPSLSSLPFPSVPGSHKVKGVYGLLLSVSHILPS